MIDFFVELVALFKLTKLKVKPDKRVFVTNEIFVHRMPNLRETPHR